MSTKQPAAPPDDVWVQIPGKPHLYRNKEGKFKYVPPPPPPAPGAPWQPPKGWPNVKTHDEDEFDGFGGIPVDFFLRIAMISNKLFAHLMGLIDDYAAAGTDAARQKVADALRTLPVEDKTVDPAEREILNVVGLLPRRTLASSGDAASALAAAIKGLSKTSQ